MEEEPHARVWRGKKKYRCKKAREKERKGMEGRRVRRKILSNECGVRKNRSIKGMNKKGRMEVKDRDRSIRTRCSEKRENRGAWEGGA